MSLSDPAAALGPPLGGGAQGPDSTSVVTLGGFGGSLTLRFDHVVEDHPLNPHGMDAIVFGNALWVDAQAQRHWAECATIEIALDANADGLIDDSEGWYLIPGSHIADAMAALATRTWDDEPDNDVPPASLSWLPPGAVGTWTTSAFGLPLDPFADVIVENPSADADLEGIFGYAEYTPTLRLGDLDGDNVVDDATLAPEAFYTVPDDPLSVGITPRSGGGDAFDIAWAVDPLTGEPAGLEGFDFLRLTNPLDVVLPLVNEKSPEIDAVADAAPDPLGDGDHDGDIDLADAAVLQQCFAAGAGDGVCQRMDHDDDGAVDLADARSILHRVTGPW